MNREKDGKIISEFAKRGDRPLLSIIIPVYNEERTIRELIARVMETPYDKQIVVVDDASTDNTWNILRELNNDDMTLLRHDKNRGKGAAIQTAQQHLQGMITIIQDADLEYDPGDFPDLLRPILDGRADAVYGSRFLGGPHRVLLFWHRLGNAFITFFSNMMTNLNLTDMETGYKVFKTEIFQSMKLRSERFGIEPEITARLSRMNARIYETPISYSGRSYAEGKKITWRDGLAAVWHIIKFRFTV